jgi:ABC-type multidrug transport system fused ATPase/permease subunit
MLSNFWNVLWLFFWGFAFISYLFALFAVIGDLFRDRQLNGGWKALWILFLIFLPFLTVLVYLIARGRGMAERQSKQVDQAKQQTENYIREVATVSSVDDIAKAKQLLDQGVITQAEFDSLKAKALS